MTLRNGQGAGFMGGILMRRTTLHYLLSKMGEVEGNAGTSSSR